MYKVGGKRMGAGVRYGEVITSRGNEVEALRVGVSEFQTWVAVL